ncbi:MAG: phosphoribosyl-AMP cyclohydrolase [Gammaproteobacteria bacterium]
MSSSENQTGENQSWLDAVKWNSDGLVPVITQDFDTGTVLTQAWMNREALSLTQEEARAVYWSRSRQKLWHKGEESGHQQIIKEILLDCDNDALLIRVEQIGGIACHTGRARCFYQRLENNQWVITDPVIKDPEEIYKK